MVVSLRHGEARGVVRGEWGGPLPQFGVLPACETPGSTGFEVCAHVVFHRWVVLGTARLPVCPGWGETSGGPGTALEVRWLLRERCEAVNQLGTEQQQPGKREASCCLRPRVGRSQEAPVGSRRTQAAWALGRAPRVQEQVGSPWPRPGQSPWSRGGCEAPYRG